MSPRKKVYCILCERSIETATTGSLSKKDEVTAHQNCLLFSAGLVCKNSPEFDDLFGFSVEDVRDEVKRGRRLVCRRCGKRGATVGCEDRRCKKTYHYPCAIEARAVAVEDEKEGKYVVYCFDHYQRLQDKQSKKINERPSSFSNPTTSRGEGKRRARASVCSTDSSISATHLASKRRLSDDDDDEQGQFLKRNNGSCKRRIICDSPNSDDNEPNIEIFAPLESDLEDSANSVHDDQVIGKNSENHTGVMSENQQQSQEEDDTGIHSDPESESLLEPVGWKEPQSAALTKDAHTSPMATDVKLKVIFIKSEDVKAQGYSPEQKRVQCPDQHNAGPPVPQQSSTEPPPSPKFPYPQATLNTHTPSPPVRPAAAGIDSASFWKSCNAAGCTQAIFTDFIHEMDKISERIQSDQANQEDYDRALKVIRDSGKLTQLVAKQQQELQRKRNELNKAAEAMDEVVSAVNEQVQTYSC